jgi:hypothetical protein
MGLLLRLANSHRDPERARRARQLLIAQLRPADSPLIQRIAASKGNHRRRDVASTLLAAQLQHQQTKLAYRKSRIKR